MKPPIKGFWAKLERDGHGRIMEWLPVSHHCADVAACCEGLLQVGVLRKRLAGLGGLSDLDGVQRQRLCVLAALHDIGKFNNGFQNKALPDKQRPFEASHVREVLALFGTARQEQALLTEAIGAKSMQGWCKDPEGLPRLLVATLSHHGRPVPVGENHQSVYWEKRNGKDPFEGMARLVLGLHSVYPEAWQTAQGSHLPSNPAFQHAFNGLIILADWLGSDTRFFPLSLPQDDADDPAAHDVAGRIEWSRRWAKKAMRFIGLDSEEARASIDKQASSFSLVSHFEPRPTQKAILELPLPSEGSVTVLEAKTGDGKTEAALARFMELFRAGKVDGIYFALPTRTAATQIHNRVFQAITRAFPDEATRPAVILAVPGYLAVDDKVGRRLPGFEVQWPDDDSERFRHRAWASENPKRYLAGTVVIGTIDQVLLSTLAVSHAHLRATALLRHLIVVDEVHASDAYMSRLLEAVLSRHVSAGGHAFLMSATLAAKARATLSRPGRMASWPDHSSARRVPFPLVTHIEHRQDDPGTEKSTSTDLGESLAISMELQTGWESPALVARMGLDAAVAGAKVLIIRNTVKECVNTQEAMESMAVERGRQDLLFDCKGRSAPHHSRYAREDRQSLDEHLERRFGKERDSRGCVVVATQTVQQSLDLDADLMITDLCPVDVLLQRLGRLHRHQRGDRPNGFESPRAVVLVPEQRDLSEHIDKGGDAKGPCGLGTVYSDLRVLEATWRVLESNPNFEIPAQCRQLVEDALHPEVLSALEEELGEKWKAHARKTLGALLADRRVAQLNLAPYNIDFGQTGCLFPDQKLERRIQTRLGEGDRLADFQEAFDSPFGNRIRRLTIPAWMAENVAIDETPELLSSSNESTSFSFGHKEYLYDRLGLRPIVEDSPQ